MTAPQQQAVLLLAAQLQQERDESVTLAEVIRIGEEAGLNRDIIEEAYRQVMAQPSEKLSRKQLERSLGNELAAVHLTILWIVATWLGALFLPMLDIFGVIGVGGTVLVFPWLIGALVKRPWYATALAMGVSMNMLITLSVKFGVPTEMGAQQGFMLLVVPLVLAYVGSMAFHRLIPGLLRKIPS
ncbi:MAG: hypothetical protein KF884_02690 [Fimbriimonadaceae bacterium]|nr:hypothetical protein [Fimbriimonadaceae bacterium]QYK59003.1 MAG: hypothetical protein KF884_02690 [Fimbriimonadaceae bacterium]